MFNKKKTSKNDSNNVIKKSIENSNEKIKKLIENYFLDHNKKDIKILKSDIREILLNNYERINYWENRRTQYLQLAIGMFAASMVVIAANIPGFLKLIEGFSNGNSNLTEYTYLTMFVPSIYLFWRSINLLKMWNIQNTPDYPFNRFPEIWRWQYRHAEGLSIDTDIPNYDDEVLKEQIKKFAINIVYYLEKTLGANQVELFKQDIEQLFLLITNEKFKMDFVTQLKEHIFTTINGIKWIFILSIMVYIMAQF